MSDQENKQANQDLPADPAEQSKPAPKPSPEKQSEKQAPPPAKITAPPSKKVKNPKRVAAGKALAAKNIEKLAKIKAFEESELAKQDQQDKQTSEATEGDQTESVKQPNTNPDWSSSVLFLVGGVAVVGGLSAFGYQKWTASANQQTSRPVKQPVTKPNAIKLSEPAKRSEAAGDNQEKNSDPFGDL